MSNGSTACLPSPLWDSRRRRLLLARDPLGKKPLYYAQLGAEMIFGSELKALRLHPQLSDALDLESVNTYLALGYTLAPRTILRDVRQVRPGEVLIFEDGNLRQRRYWEPSPGHDPAAPGPGPRLGLGRRVRRAVPGTHRASPSTSACSPTCHWAPSSAAASTPAQW